MPSETQDLANAFIFVVSVLSYYTSVTMCLIGPMDTCIYGTLVLVLFDASTTMTSKMIKVPCENPFSHIDPEEVKSG